MEQLSLFDAVKVAPIPLLSLNRVMIDGVPVMAYRKTDETYTVFPYGNHFYNSKIKTISENEFDELIIYFKKESGANG